MKNHLMKLSLVLVLFFVSLYSVNAKTIKVLQFNIWQEGTVVNGGFEAIADEIIRSDADFITLSEVRNYNQTRFCDRMIQALRQRGKTYYSFLSEDSGLLSRYPISDSLTVFPLNDDRGSIYKMVTCVEGKEFAVYTAHLDYRNCAYYDARGYDGNNWHKLDTPVTDMNKLLELNRLSVRDDAIACFLKEAEKDQIAGRMIILGGDFNEPSHLDWTENTKNMWDHNGLVVPWDVSVMLEKAGYKDAYREKYPNPLTHPGFTCPADCKNIELDKLVWSPEADDRDRIDYIIYKPTFNFQLEDIQLIGPKGDIKRGKRICEETKDIIVEPIGIWPTDHKAVIATFQFN